MSVALSEGIGYRRVQSSDISMNYGIMCNNMSCIYQYILLYHVTRQGMSTYNSLNERGFGNTENGFYIDVCCFFGGLYPKIFYFGQRS